MRARNPREPYRGHVITYEPDGWWEVQRLDLKDGEVIVGGFARDEAEARLMAEDMVDGITGRAANPDRLPNIIVRKQEAERLLHKPLRGRKTDYYVLSKPKNLGGPYRSKEKAKVRLRQVETFKRLKPTRRANWTGDSDQAAEYALKRWGHAHYLATQDPYRGIPSNPTWKEFADWIRRTADPGADEVADAVEQRRGHVRDFPLRVEPMHLPDLHWRRSRVYDGFAAPGDYVSAEIAPGVRYEVLEREGFDVYLDDNGSRLYVASEENLERAQRAAALDYMEWRAHTRDGLSDRQQNPGARWDLQTVIVDKSVAPTRKEATQIARRHARRIYTSRETGQSWRFRQRPPSDFVPGSFRTRRIPGRGVSLVHGRLKKAAKGPTMRARPRRRR